MTKGENAIYFYRLYRPIHSSRHLNVKTENVAMILEPSDWGLTHPKQASSGLETANKLLRAKVTLQQQEMDKLTQERDQKEGKIQNLEEILKSGDEEKKRLSKTIQSLQSQLDKHKKSQEMSKKTTMDHELEIQALRKDIDVLDRERKQTQSEANNKDLKLNRALQELEKYKTLLAKASSDSKEKLDGTKKAADKMFADNNRLMKQKQDLLMAFKKQAQLIDVLKKQKMHLESSKLLEFTEEEFLRILESR